MTFQVVKEETVETYTKIWFLYSVGGERAQDLAKTFDLAPSTVYRAISWAAENKKVLSNSVLAEVAKEQLEDKVRQLDADLKDLRGNQPVNWKAVSSIYALWLGYRQQLWKLQHVIQDRSSITLNNMVEPLKPEQMAEELRNSLTEDQRLKLAEAIDAIFIEGHNNAEYKAG